MLVRLLTASRFEELPLRVVALLFTLPLRVPVLTVPLVPDELLDVEFTLPDLETLALLLLLETSGL